MRTIPFLSAALAFLILSSSAAFADTRYSLRVDGITCPFCVATSEKALKKIKGVKSVTSNLKAGRFSVCVAPNVELTDAQLKSLFRSKGFTYRSMRRQGAC